MTTQVLLRSAHCVRKLVEMFEPAWSIQWIGKLKCWAHAVANRGNGHNGQFEMKGWTPDWRFSMGGWNKRNKRWPLVSCAQSELCICQWHLHSIIHLDFTVTRQPIIWTIFFAAPHHWTNTQKRDSQRKTYIYMRYIYIFVCGCVFVCVSVCVRVNICISHIYHSTYISILFYDFDIQQYLRKVPFPASVYMSVCLSVSLPQSW